MLRRFLGGDESGADAAATPGGPAAAAPAGSAAETATVRQIVARLETMPPADARYLACFAYVMSRAAHADLSISDEETAVMERFAAEYGGLDESQAVLVVGMAKLSAAAYGATEDYVVTREFKKISTMDQRLQLLRCCFAISATDGTINADEASVVNEIAKELDIERPQLNAVRDEFHDQLSSVQALRQVGG
ncbi:MAG TPA: TerB family tellurite resistance protein [Candidatus Limnocylindrales bacterium]|nr:TerB family tellurite resistance protein [Candidatus Limnocylindrales bacterium]